MRKSRGGVLYLQEWDCKTLPVCYLHILMLEQNGIYSTGSMAAGQSSTHEWHPHLTSNQSGRVIFSTYILYISYQYYETFSCNIESKALWFLLHYTEISTELKFRIKIIYVLQVYIYKTIQVSDVIQSFTHLKMCTNVWMYVSICACGCLLVCTFSEVPICMNNYECLSLSDLATVLS